MNRFFLLFCFFCIHTVVFSQNDSIFSEKDSLTWSKMIKEVVVKGHRKNLKFKGNSIVASVANTELAQLGTANDVLLRLPFINMHDEDINVVGKGIPMILIDNRIVRNNAELQMLKSENVKNIEIILSPGAEYSSEIKSVIKIQTKHSFIKGLGGKLTSQTTRKRVWGEIVMADLSYNWTHWQLFGQILYNIDGSRNKVENNTSFLYNDCLNQLQNNAIQRNRKSMGNVKGGFNWNDKLQSFGAYYQFDNLPTHIKNYGSENDGIAGKKTEHIRKLIDIDSKSKKHLVSVYYDGSFKNGSLLHFDGNYLHTWYTDDNMTKVLYDNDENNEIVPSLTGMKSNLWAGKLYYELPFATAKLNIGTEGSYTFNSQKYEIKNEAISYIPSTTNDSRQNNIAVFASFLKEWHALSFQLGMRWEYVKFDYKHNDVLDRNVSKTDNSFSPNVSMSYNFNDNAYMSLDYSHSIIRPPYKQLRSSLLYVGPYEVEGGNPTLADCKTNMLNYLFGWRDLMFEVSYSQQDDSYVFTKEHYTSDTPILIFRPKQANLSSLNIYISYAPVIKFWKPNLTLGMDKQWLTLYGECYDKPVFRYMFKNMFIPSKKWLVTLDIAGNTCGHMMANRMRSQWTVDFSVRRFLMQKRLQITLAANDIFHTCNQNWYMNVKDIKLCKSLDVDTRKLMLTVSWHSNNSPWIKSIVRS